MGNLTLEKRLVRPLTEPRPEPGCHVAVFKEVDGGKSFERVIPPGQRFRKGLLEWFSTYTAYAVPADPTLRHRFVEQYGTGTGDLHDEFNLHVTLSYRVVHPELLAERVDRDPLGHLQSAVKDILLRQASKLRFEELEDDVFDLEAYVLRIREHPPSAGEPSYLERFRELARDLGIELQRVEIACTPSSKKVEIGGERVQGRREADLEKERTAAELEIRKLRRQGERQIEVLDSVAAGLRRIIDNVAGDVGTVRELRGVVGEVAEVREEFGRVLGGGPSRAIDEGREHGELGVAGETVALSDGLTRRWRPELERMFEVVATLDCRPSEKRVLVGKILHVLAEASLGGHSSNGRLPGYLEDLKQYCDSIDLASAMTRPEHHRYLSRFRDVETLRRMFAEGEPSTAERAGDEHSS